MITTTLNKIRRALPCKEGWEKLLANLGKTKADDEPLPLTTILDSNGLEDCLWALRTVPEHDSLWRKYAVWCARQVEHLITDERSTLALDVAWRHSNGEATDEDLVAAEAAAEAASWDAARDAARAAAGAAQESKLRDILNSGAWSEAPPQEEV